MGGMSSRWGWTQSLRHGLPKQLDRINIFELILSFEFCFCFSCLTRKHLVNKCCNLFFFETVLRDSFPTVDNSVGTFLMISGKFPFGWPSDGLIICRCCFTVSSPTLETRVSCLPSRLRFRCESSLLILASLTNNEPTCKITTHEEKLLFSFEKLKRHLPPSCWHFIPIISKQISKRKKNLIVRRQMLMEIRFYGSQAKDNRITSKRGKPGIAWVHCWP